MDSNFNCPVPVNQRPQEEYKQLYNSCFFSWPTNEDKDFRTTLFKVWAIIMPICLLILSGSLILKTNIIKLFLTGNASSFFIIFLLLSRQWLGWNYLFKRLYSENIEYEETGWYDGQTWEKPIEWREKDLLIAMHEVKPIIKYIEKTLWLTLITTISFGFIGSLI